MRFVLVDRILSLSAGKEIVAVRCISADEEYLRDHFPGFPVVPGVLLIEMMGQAAAKCLEAERRERGKAMLARVLSASFRDWVRPGDQVMLNATIASNADRYATADCRALVGDRRVAQAKLMFTFVPIERFSPGYRDEVLEEFLANQA